MTDQNKPEDAIPEEDAAEASVDEPTEAEGSAETEPVSGAKTAAAASAAKSGPEEPPYIDDPVSKWWIGAIIAVFALIFVVVVLFGRGGFTSHTL